MWVKAEKAVRKEGYSVSGKMMRDWIKTMALGKAEKEGSKDLRGRIDSPWQFEFKESQSGCSFSVSWRVESS